MLPQLVAASLLVTFAFVAAAPAEAVSITVCAPPDVDCTTVDPGTGTLVGCASATLNQVTITVCV
ncbi:MAG TPA: hypothetical protein VGR28_00150 [Candidatus Thermoplasmatota archaeon]|jgi:hypothetical protein|nr:hypothetical protein [Candidatus Thermoplasmatota archaeon]